MAKRTIRDDLGFLHEIEEDEPSWSVLVAKLLIGIILTWILVWLIRWRSEQATILDRLENLENILLKGESK